MSSLAAGAAGDIAAVAQKRLGKRSVLARGSSIGFRLGLHGALSDCEQAAHRAGNASCRACDKLQLTSDFLRSVAECEPDRDGGWAQRTFSQVVSHYISSTRGADTALDVISSVAGPSRIRHIRCGSIRLKRVATFAASVTVPTAAALRGLNSTAELKPHRRAWPGRDAFGHICDWI